MKIIRFTCETEIEEGRERYIDKIGLEVNFKLKNKMYIMGIGLGVYDFRSQNVVKNGYHILCDHIGYDFIHFKNHLIKHYGCTYEYNKFIFTEENADAVIEWLESFKIMDKLIE